MKEIGGLEQSMTKKNNEVEVVETVTKDVETMPINSNDVELPKRKGFFSKRDKSAKKGIHKNELTDGAKKSMRTRIISAIVGLGIIVPALFLGDWIYFAVITFALGVACYEILGCTNKRTVVTVIVYFIFVALIAYWPLFRTMAISGAAISKIDQYYQMIYLPIIVMVVGVFLVFLLTVIYKDFTVHDACFMITMAILVGFGFQCLFYLRCYPITLYENAEVQAWNFTINNTIKPSMLLVFVILSTFMTDTGAYFVGVFFGKNKMNERISPKKTWEGFVGGVVISFLLSSAFGITVTACGFPLFGDKEGNYFVSLSKNWYLILILSLIIPLFATLGDFVFSSIKRYWGIKDYGKLIPGHGGVLDRLDSILFTVIVASIFVFMLSAINEGKFNWDQFLV